MVHAAQQAVQRVVAAGAHLGAHAVGLERRDIDGDRARARLDLLVELLEHRAGLGELALGLGHLGGVEVAAIERGASSSIEAGTASAFEPSFRRSFRTFCLGGGLLRAQRGEAAS